MKVSALVVFCFVPLLSVSAFETELKMVSVDFTKVIENCDQVKALNAEIEEQNNQINEEVERRRKLIQLLVDQSVELSTKYDKLGEGEGTIKKELLDEIEKLQVDYINQSQLLINYQEEKNQEITQILRDKNGLIQFQVNEAIEEIRKIRGCELVINRSADVSNQNNFVFYLSDKVPDITQEVIDLLNQKYLQQKQETLGEDEL